MTSVDLISKSSVSARLINAMNINTTFMLLLLPLHIVKQQDDCLDRKSLQQFGDVLILERPKFNRKTRL